jgi:hypothetical protein
LAIFLAFLSIASRIRTSVRNKLSNRKLVEKMTAIASYRVTNPRKLFRGVAILILTAGFAVSSINGSMAGGGAPGELEFISVSAGDSLWALAAVHAPKSDPRDWIADVVLLNNLETVDLVPGQQIALP